MNAHMERKENTVYVLSLSYGKDSLACLGAIEKLGWPLDAIVHAEVWATDTIPADLPPMVEFKQRADAVIKERYGIEVQHISASRQRERERATNQNSIVSASEAVTSEKYMDSQLHPVDGVGISSLAERLTYEDIFYRAYKKNQQRIYGFPMGRAVWCTGELKQAALRKSMTFLKAPHRGRTKILWCNILELLSMNQ